MNIRLIHVFSFLITFIISSLGFTAPGPLVTITGTGGQPPFNVNVWLNGDSPLSGQSFTVTGGYNLTITPTIPNHTYPAMGIEVTTPGVFINAGCSRFVGNRCIFSASKSSPASLTAGSGTPTTSCGGTDGACRVYVTNATTSGNINGFASSACNSCTPGLGCANCLCNNDTNKPSSGVYKAWLSTNSTSAIANTSYIASQTYRTATITGNDRVIFNQATPVGDINAPLAAINPGSLVQTWTGTGSDGFNISGSNCSNWTDGTNSFFGAVGKTNVTDSTWTDDGISPNCSSQNYLYCFEVPS